MRLWGVLENVNEWVRFADAKAGAVLALCGASLAFIVDHLYGVRTTLLARDFDPLSLLLYATFSAYLVLLIRTMSAAFQAIVPRVVGSQSKSLLHFGDIASEYGERPEAFVSKVRQLSDEGMDEETLRQVVAVSKVAKVKYEFIAISIRRLAWAAGLWIGVLVSLFIMGG